MEPNLGQIAYEAYYTYSDGRSLISGAALPTWADQASSIQEAWTAAANAVAATTILGLADGGH